MKATNPARTQMAKKTRRAVPAASSPVVNPLFTTEGFAEGDIIIYKIHNIIKTGV